MVYGKGMVLTGLITLGLLLGASAHDRIGGANGTLGQVARAADFTQAPEFSLPAYTGETVRLSEVLPRKKVTILNFFATWCPPCNAEMPDFVEFHKEYGSRVSIIGIDLNESKTKVGQFIKKHNIKFPVLLDYKGDTGNGYGVFSIPSTFILDQKGRVLESFTGMTDKASLEAAVRKALK